MDARSRVFVSVKTKDMNGAAALLRQKFGNAKLEEDYIRVYDVDDTEAIVKQLLESGHTVSEVKKNKVGLEEYYIDLMSKKEDK